MSPVTEACSNAFVIFNRLQVSLTSMHKKCKGVQQHTIAANQSLARLSGEISIDWVPVVSCDCL